MNGGGSRESLQQHMYANSLPHAPMYAAVVPGMQQRVHPIVSSLQLGNGGYPEYYKLAYPSFLVQNGSLYNSARVPTGICRLTTEAISSLQSQKILLFVVQPELVLIE